MVCEDFVNYKVHLYVGPVLALPDFVPVLERLIFPNKSPYRDFPRYDGGIVLGVKNYCRDFFLVLICAGIFFGHLSKVPSVLIGLKTPVLGGGYTVKG